MSIFSQQGNVSVVVGPEKELPIHTPRGDMVNLFWLKKSESPAHALYSAVFEICYVFSSLLKKLFLKPAEQKGTEGNCAPNVAVKG